MNINEIADKLNELAKATSNLSKLQPLRAELKGLIHPRTYKIFSASTVFDGDDIYAFHDGGRSEIQFNVGLEYLDDQEIFRYGLGFSLEPNQSQSDPVNFLTPKIRALNDYINNDPSLLEDLLMWHYKEPSHDGRSNNFRIAPIPDDWIVWGNFIFLGKYFVKGVDEIDNNDLQEIIETFDRLVPVFEFVESNFSNYTLSTSGKRISRICWNDNGWIKPSGRYGKSNDQDTHEGQYGYGHEEWLGDISKTIDGYHYGFLESIRKSQETFAGKFYDVDLFAINGINHNRYLIGTIQNLEVLDEDTVTPIKNYYRKHGWLAEMENQILAAGANNEGFSNWDGVDLFNIRFRPTDLHFFSDYILVKDDNIQKIQRYSFAHKTEGIRVAIPINNSFVFYPTEEDIEKSVDIETTEYEREAKPIEISYLHKKIRDNLHRHLVKRFGGDIGKENPTGQGTLIDIVRKQDGKTIFYEIKTYNSLKACIREAIGQLLEYAFWPNSENADEIIIVSQNDVTPDCITYLQKLRDKFELSIYYQQFDLVTAQLSEKY